MLFAYEDVVKNRSEVVRQNFGELVYNSNGRSGKGVVKGHRNWHSTSKQGLASAGQMHARWSVPPV